MPITPKQIEARQDCIGGSDIAAILGLDPFRTKYDVWLEKTRRIVKEEEPQPSQYMLAGQWFEEGVLQFAEERLGTLKRNQTRRIVGTPIRVNIDALVVATGHPVEAKTSGLFGPLREEWGEDGTDEIPARVIVQSHGGMMAVKEEMAHVPAFLGGRGFLLFVVLLNRTLAEIILEQCDDFWRNNVCADIPPENVIGNLELLKRIKRQPDSISAVEPATVEEWLAAKEELKAATEKANKAQAAVLTALGDAEAGDAGEFGAVTYFERQRAGYTVAPTSYRELKYEKGGLTNG